MHFRGGGEEGGGGAVIYILSDIIIEAAVRYNSEIKLGCLEKLREGQGGTMRRGLTSSPRGRLCMCFS